MTGAADHHIRHAPALIGLPPIRAWVRPAMKFLPSHQFLLSELVHDLVRMKLGVGQGLVHAGAISNTTFTHAVELNGAGICTRAFIRRHSILFYKRYADNLFFVVHDESCAAPLLSELLPRQDGTSPIAPYSCKLEDSGFPSVEMPDLTIFKSADFESSSRLSYPPKFKGEGTVLSQASCHLPSTCFAWPLSLIHRSYRLSSSIEIFRIARAHILQTLKHVDYDDGYMPYLIDNTDFICPFHRMPPRRAPKLETITIVLPYHPVWYKAGLSGILQRFVKDPRWSHIFRTFNVPIIRVAWHY